MQGKVLNTNTAVLWNVCLPYINLINITILYMVIKSAQISSSQVLKFSGSQVLRFSGSQVWVFVTFVPGVHRNISHDLLTYIHTTVWQGRSSHFSFFVKILLTVKQSIERLNFLLKWFCHFTMLHFQMSFSIFTNFAIII